MKTRVFQAAVISLLVLSSTAAAQKRRDNFSLEARGYGGYLFENKVDFKNHYFGSADITAGFTSDLTGGDAYSAAYGYPTYGLGACACFLSDISLPEPSSLGNFYSLYGFFERDVFRYRNFTAGYSLEFGGAYNPVRYNPVDNPQNYYVSSVIMVHAAAGLHAKWRFAGNFEAGLRFRAKHYSNGRSALPNYGLNMLEAGLSLGYYFISDRRSGGGSFSDGTADFEIAEKTPSVKGFEFHITLGGGPHCTGSDWNRYNRRVKEPAERETDFRMYPRFSVSADAMYRYCLKAGTGLLLEAFCVPDIKTLEKNDRAIYGDDAVEDGPGYSPFSMGIAVVQEFHFRNFAVWGALGIYPFKPKLGLSGDVSWNYQKGGVRYYVPKWGDIFFGLAVKANDFQESEYMEFSIGIRL